MKIAIHLLVHKNKLQIVKLIEHFKTHFDIYIHVDKKSNLELKDFKLGDNVFVYKKYKLYWGSFNIVKATLLLLSESLKNNYSRHILLSGQDLPLITNDEIIDFYKKNENIEFIHALKLPRKDWGNGGLDRIYSYNLISTKGLSKMEILRILPFNVKNMIIQYLNIKNKIKFEFWGGSQWFELSNLGVQEIFTFLKNNPKYIKLFKHSACSDELFFHTILYNSKNVNISSDYNRFINWSKGPDFPRILDNSDYEEVVNSKNIFARKFDLDINKEVIDRLYNRLYQTNNKF